MSEDKSHVLQDDSLIHSSPIYLLNVIPINPSEREDEQHRGAARWHTASIMHVGVKLSIMKTTYKMCPLFPSESCHSGIFLTAVWNRPFGCPTGFKTLSWRNICRPSGGPLTAWGPNQLLALPLHKLRLCSQMFMDTVHEVNHATAVRCWIIFNAWEYLYNHSIQMESVRRSQTKTNQTDISHLKTTDRDNTSSF